jgi:DNA-binding XRE family transcriptional regulator
VLALSFAELVKDVRKELGWSQATMASALHVSRTVIHRWETGKSKPVLADLFCVLAPHLAAALAGKPPKRYTSKQLREVAAGEIINCMGLAKDCSEPLIYEYGKTLVIRIPAILDAAEDPHPPCEEMIQAMLVLGRQKMAEVLPGYRPSRMQ